MRFVLLEHTWNGVHFDLMLEGGNELETWAIDEPIRSGIWLPARRLPPHRLAYLEYEGAVSHGRGSVRRLDQGTYELIHADATVRRFLLVGQVLRGEGELRAVASSAPVFDSASGSPTWRFLLRNRD